MRYQKFIRALACTGMIAFSWVGGSGNTLELDLQTALQRAPTSNFQILLSEEAITSQEEATRIARSGLYPRVSLEATQSRSMNPNLGALSRSIPGIPNRFYNDRFDALVRARLALFDAGTWDDFKISKLSLQATRNQVDYAVQQILQRIAISFFTHWRNERRLNVIDANLERDELLLRIARDQQEAGVATALDVTRAEVRFATNELARLQQETMVMGSALDLKRILNIPLQTDMVIKSHPEALMDPYTEFSAGRFEQVLNRRADYQQLLIQVERESLALKATRRERLPSLFVGGEWGYASESWSDDMEEQWAIQVGLSVPLFEGFRLDAQTRQAASLFRQRELELRDLRQEIEAEYRFSLQNLQSSLRQVAVAKRAVALNIREFDLARIRFEEGVADNSDVVTAQAALADAEDALVEAEYQYVQARIDHARVEGDVRAILRD